MKIYRLPHLADLDPTGEYLLGDDELGTGAVTVLYGRLRRGEQPRTVSAGEHRTSVFFVIKGEVAVRHGRSTFSIGPGEAFHMEGAEEFSVEAASGDETAYLVASGCGNPQNRGASAHDAAAGDEESPEGPTRVISPAAEVDPEETGGGEAEDDGFLITRDDPETGRYSGPVSDDHDDSDEGGNGPDRGGIW